MRDAARIFEDLKRIHRDNIYSHFFGSIVSTRADEKEYVKNCNIPASALEFELALLADNVIEDEDSDI